MEDVILARESSLYCSVFILKGGSYPRPSVKGSSSGKNSPDGVAFSRIGLKKDDKRAFDDVSVFLEQCCNECVFERRPL